MEAAPGPLFTPPAGALRTTPQGLDSNPGHAASGRLDFLDGARGVASVVIVLSHLLSAWLPALAFGAADHRMPYLTRFAHTPLAIFWSGDMAVMVFFIHSGFVLSNRFFSTEDRADLARQAVKRVVRLGVPVAVAVLLTGALFQLHAMHNLAAADLSKSTWLASFYVPGPHPGLLWTAFGGAMLRGQVWWMGPLWSVNIQFFGSLLVFALISLFRDDRRRNAAFAFVVAWALIAGSSHFGIHLAAITIGVWFRSMRDQPAGPLRRWAATTARTRFLRAMALLAFVYFGSWPDEEAVGPWYSFVARRLSFTDSFLRPRSMAHTLAASAVVWLIFSTPAIKSFLTRRTVQTIGKWSFAIYLLHWPIMMSLGSWVFASTAARTHSIYLGAVIASALTVLATALAAGPFTRLVDRPAINLANRVAAWWGSPSPTDGRVEAR